MTHDFNDKIILVNWVRYDADEAERKILGYETNDVTNAVKDVVAQYGSL